MKCPDCGQPMDGLHKGECSWWNTKVHGPTPIKLVTPLPFEEQSKKDSAELLREALARAESGGVLGVIIVTKDTDGMWSHQTTASMSIREEIGAIECLKWDRIYRSHR